MTRDEFVTACLAVRSHVRPTSLPRHARTGRTSATCSHTIRVAEYGEAAIEAHERYGYRVRAVATQTGSRGQTVAWVVSFERDEYSPCVVCEQRGRA